MNTYVRIFLAVIMLVTSQAMLGMPAAAQRTQRTQADSTFVSEVSGLTVDLGDSGEGVFLHDLHEVMKIGATGQQERIWIGVGWTNITVTFVSDNNLDSRDYNQATVDLFTTGSFNKVELLGQQFERDHSWLLTRRTWQHGPRELHYNEIYHDIGNGTTVVVTMYSHESTLLNHIAWSQENLTVDGYHVFTGTDFAGIQSMIDGTSPHKPVVAENPNSNLADWKPLGLRTGTEWRNPIHKTVVTWSDRSWYFPHSYPEAILNNEETGTAQLTLRSTDSTAAVFITVVENTDDLSGKEWTDLWSSEEWLQESYPDHVVVSSKHTNSSASVIYTARSKYDEPLTVHRESLNLANGTTVITEIKSIPQAASTAYLGLTDGIQIDGEPMDSFWTTAEIHAVVFGDRRASGASRTNRSDRTSQSTVAIDSVASKLTDAKIEINTSTGAAFDHDSYYLNETETESAEVFVITMDTTRIEIIIFNGRLLPSEFQTMWSDQEAVSASHVERLGGESDARSSWGVYNQAHYLDYREYSYVTVQSEQGTDTHIAIVISSSEAKFVGDVTWTQENVTINDESILPDTDVGLIAVVAAGESDYPVENLTVRGTSFEDWAYLGLVSETSWQGPIYDTSFTWDGDLWQLTYNRTDAIVIDHDRGHETLILETPNRKGMVKLRTLEELDTPAGWVDWWLSDEYREADPGFRFTVIGSTTTDTTGSVILQFETALGEPVIVIRDVYINGDGVTVMTEIFASPEDIADVYSDFWDGVQSNGDYYPLTWTIEEIENL